MHEESLSTSRQVLCPLVAPGTDEDTCQSPHCQCLRIEGRCVAYHFPTQVQQYLGNVDLDRADLVAGPTQGRSVGQGRGPLDAQQLRGEDGADRTGIDRAVGVST